MTPRRWAALAAVLVLAGAGCTFGKLRLSTTTASAAQANPLCPPPQPAGTPAPTGGTLPPDLARVATEVQQVRGLRFDGPVNPEPLTQEQMQQELGKSLDEQFPKEEVDREGKVLLTVGALPPGTDLHRSLVTFAKAQIIGFYDSETKRLVFEGGAAPTPFQRFTLAHELTHALQDQNFDLSRVDRLGDTCQDERVEAFRSLAEGDAVETQVEWAQSNLSTDEIAKLQQEAESFPPSPPTPPFVENLFAFPYPNGQAFVQALQLRGGEEAVDDAYRNPPVSTEQILHPDRYPDDVPQPVAIPDLSSALGQGWSLTDHEEIGEAWLLTLLELRLSDSSAKEAAAGWDGGLLRSWSNGSENAVLLRTVWDSPADAGEFAAAMQDWFEVQAAEVHRDGTSVDVLFGSDQQALAALSAAASS